MKYLIWVLFTATLCEQGLVAQPALPGKGPGYWQQHIKYQMDIQMDVNTNQFRGRQKLQYTNNSPDTLHQLFYHLYFNAFQPNSMMDNRSRMAGTFSFGRDKEGKEQLDWDPRIKDRILNLQPNEIGYQKILSLKMNGIAQPFEVEETILQVRLTRPILPRSTVVLDMEFEAQVPLQVRRSGRDSRLNGVRYSMSQWYPRLCEYDDEGWHPTPYVAREFYGVWGDFDINITIDKNYILGGTGYLQNANQIGYGYEDPGTKVVRPTGNLLTWHFVAPNVHDFMWAADPDYRHLVRNVPNGPVVHVLYRPRNDSAYNEGWTALADAAPVIFPFASKHFGSYAYRQFTFIQGGDGSMEYPMATLITASSLGSAIHEMMHNWCPMMMGTNESEYPWMDEGYADFSGHLVSAYYRESVTRKQLEGNSSKLKSLDSLAAILPLDQFPSYRAYYNLVKSGLEEPLSTHSDHYLTNFAYDGGAYAKGCVFLEQLGYIIGAQNRDRFLLEYYKNWKFRHPRPNDLFRVAEKVSGIQLDWYREFWIQSTKTIDYGIDSLWEEGGKTRIRILNRGTLPMPLDVMLTFKDGSRELDYIPQYFMFGGKPAESKDFPRYVHEPWEWTNPYYVFEVNRKLTDLKALEIDASQRMADIDRKNNRLELNW